MLSKQQILDAPEEAYMNDEQLQFFQHLLVDLKQQTMAHIEEMKNAFSHPPEINEGKEQHYMLD